MPSDGAMGAGARYSIAMPWRGRNAEILARRHAPPRLPLGWGSSFTKAPRIIGVRVAPALPDQELRDAAIGFTLHERLLGLLHALAARGTHLPALRELADLLGLPGEEYRRVAMGMGRLARNGLVRSWRGHDGQGVLWLAETGRELRTPCADPRVTFL